ncbi:Uncharacterised protein [Burkholderia pseudomallei]|nr:Uncharacterised protein [Burkholderia pseudomallei]
MSDRFVLISAFVTFGALGVGSYLQGDQVAWILILLLLGCFLVLFAYQLYRRRQTPAEGPPDPSANWMSVDRRPTGEAHVFRYSRGTISMLRIILLGSLLPGLIIYSVAKPRPAGMELYWFVAIWICFFGTFFLGFIACQKYGVEVTDTEIVHHRIRSPRRYPFSSLGSVALLEGGGRGAKYVLALFDKRGKVLDQFADTLEHFEELVALVKTRAEAAGVNYRYRDMWGSWTKKE